MKTFAYAAKFEPGDRRGIVVTFPDVPEAITQGKTEVDARAQAEEALGLALLSYIERGLDLPKPATRGREFVTVHVASDVAVKIAVLQAFAGAGISKSELGRRLGKDEKEIRRILDPEHPTKLGPMVEVLRALGKRLVVGVEDAA
jgi:antitoxin HicB